MKEIGADQFLRLMYEKQPLQGYKVVEDVTIKSDNTIYQSITDCIFKKITIKDKSSSVILIDCEAESITITNLKAINIIDTKFDVCAIESDSIGNSILIEGSNTIGDKLYVNGLYNKLTVSESTSIKQMLFESIEASTVTFNKVSNSNISFVTSTIRGFADFFDNENIELELTNSYIERVNIPSSKEIILKIEDVVSKKISLADGSYKIIMLIGRGDFDLDIESKTKKEKLRIDTIHVLRFLLVDKRVIKILDASFNTFHIWSFQNGGIFSLNNCLIETSFNISSSNLGKTVLNNTQVENCSTYITDTNLMDATFTNFKWNSIYEVTQSTNSSLNDLRETYRQLKANYIKNGNKIEALEFQKHELSTHYEILKGDALKKPSWRNLGNFLIVWTNRASSDFGQNIWKPLLFLFAFHLVLFNLILTYNPSIGIKMNFFNYDSDVTMKAISLYFQTILPVHSSDIKIDTKTTVSIAGFLDLLIRVSSGYFIYYFITASRKYHQ